MLARRLSNAEYNYTIRDLTGVDIRPTREFPVDPANTAGFDNSGESLTMSPALLKKYLDAARDVANHLVLERDGLAFAPHPMLVETDRDKYCVQRIVDFYQRQNTDYADYFAAAWRFKHRAALGQPRATLALAAAERQVSANYLATLWRRARGTARDGRPDGAAAGAVAGPAGARRRRRDDTAVGGRQAHARLRRLQLRKKSSRASRNRRPPGVRPRRSRWHDLAEPPVRQPPHDLRPGAAAGRGQAAAGAGPTAPEPGDRREYGPGADAAGRRTRPAIPTWSSPPASAPRYEASFARFCGVFPDTFYMPERGRNYLDKTRDRGRLLSAGFHSLMGYFRDDQPLYELLLDDAQQKQLDGLWRELDFVADATGRMYPQFISERQPRRAAAAERVTLPADTPNGEP